MNLFLWIPVLTPSTYRCSARGPASPDPCALFTTWRFRSLKPYRGLVPGRRSLVTGHFLIRLLVLVHVHILRVNHVAGLAALRAPAAGGSRPRTGACRARLLGAASRLRLLV